MAGRRWDVRIGELCGLHLVDLHLREDAACGQCRSAHVHICHREGNANRSRVKTKHPWRSVDGVVCGGAIRRASPAMVSGYFEYMTTEYPRDVAHGMLLVQLHGPNYGKPLAATAVRGMLRRASRSLGLPTVKPHQFRHSYVTTSFDAAVSLRDVQIAARHADPKTTMRYDRARKKLRPTPQLHPRRIHGIRNLTRHAEQD